MFEPCVLICENKASKLINDSFLEQWRNPVTISALNIEAPQPPILESRHNLSAQIELAMLKWNANNLEVPLTIYSSGEVCLPRAKCRTHD